MADVRDQLTLQILHLAQVLRRPHQGIVQLRDLAVSAAVGRARVAGTAQLFRRFVCFNNRLRNAAGHREAHQRRRQQNRADGQPELRPHRAEQLWGHVQPLRGAEHQHALQHPDGGNDKSRENREINQDLGPDSEASRQERFPVCQIIPFQSDSLPL